MPRYTSHEALNWGESFIITFHFIQYYFISFCSKNIYLSLQSPRIVEMLLLYSEGYSLRRGIDSTLINSPCFAKDTKKYFQTCTDQRETTAGKKIQFSEYTDTCSPT